MKKLLFFLMICLGFIGTFASGFVVAQLVNPTQQVSVTPTPIISKPSSSSPSPEVNQFLPGKFYFDDTVMLVTKDTPHMNLIATATRSEQTTNYLQNTRVSFFDGTKWDRQTDNSYVADSTIVNNSLVKRWNIQTDPSRVLKESVNGEITISKATISFSTGTLENELSIRSLPGYTKFMSQGSGTVTVNGTMHPAYVLYTRIYSLNASEIQFYNQPFGLTTDWIAFWDTNGNFYHVDTTNVDKPTPIYQTHALGIFENTSDTVSKTFQATVSRDSQNPPVQYTVSMNSPVSKILHLKRINGVNKAPNSSYVWYMGNIEGTVESNGQTLPGFGLIEYIQD